MNMMTMFDVPAAAAMPLVRYEDPLDDDAPTDAAVTTTRRGLVRLALVAAETGARFQREAVEHDPMSWLLAPRALFGGASAIDACLARQECMRGILLHGLSLGLDADAADIDALVADSDGGDVGDGTVTAAPQSKRTRRANGPHHDNVLPFRQAGGTQPRLFTATIVHDDGFETVHAFHASFATDEAEIAGRLFMRMGPAAADAAIVTGFDHTSPIVEALVSQAICDTLMMIDAEPTSPLAAGLDLNIEQRFLA